MVCHMFYWVNVLISEQTEQTDFSSVSIHKTTVERCREILFRSELDLFSISDTASYLGILSSGADLKVISIPPRVSFQICKSHLKQA